MPEGDTVHLSARRLDAALGGTRIVDSDFRVPALATVDLSGRAVERVVARGKHLFFRLSGSLRLHTHFQMGGSWHLYRPGERWRGPVHEVRVVLGTETVTAVGFSIPVIELLAPEGERRITGRLGPDALAPEAPGDEEGWAWDAAEAERRLAAQPGRALGEALLDQSVLAGVGNVYRNEICFLAGLHPNRPVGTVPEVGKVVALVRRTMWANRGTARRVTTGDPRRGRSHWVYGRGGKPCLRCRTPIATERRSPGGPERPTYWCPHCQGEGVGLVPAMT